QFAGGADQRRLLVFGVFSEHAPIVLNFCHFEEGRSTLFAVESFVQIREIRVLVKRMLDKSFHHEDTKARSFSFVFSVSP
ncbi:MAG: hypothetical protein AB1846_13520, partial [Chloroflexota bacterium]